MAALGGMAVIREGSLVDFKAQLYKERWSAVKAKRMIGSLHACIRDHTITSVALIIPHAHHTSQETKALIAAIKAHCRKKKIRISTYEPSALQRLCEASRAKKKALMKAMTLRYPELTHLHRKELSNKHEYYNKLFEAVGAATLLANECTY
jgi:hypothetical protein